MVFKKILKFFRNNFFETTKTAFVLFKIMLPVSIIVKIIQELDLLPFIGKALSPIMNLMGLPGETGLVWATAMLVNIYGGLLAYMNIFNSLSLSVAQTTILFTIILVAHSFPIELQIAANAGVKIIVSFLIRFVFAIILGIILFQIYSITGFLNETSNIPISIKQTDNSWLGWALNELKNYITIFILIYLLISILSFLKITGLIDKLNKLLYPFLSFLGIGKEAVPIALVGLTLGISYGGAIIIKEAKSNKINKRDVFYSLTLMGLCHSMIEDTMLMLAMGGDISGVLFGRMIFAIIITLLIVKITKKLKDEVFNKIFIKKLNQNN